MLDLPYQIPHVVHSTHCSASFVPTLPIFKSNLGICPNIDLICLIIQAHAPSSHARPTKKSSLNMVLGNAAGQVLQKYIGFLCAKDQQIRCRPFICLARCSSALPHATSRDGTIS
jgi:hypothetical protein